MFVCFSFHCFREVERLVAEASQGEEGCVIKLPDIPGEAKTFETVAKFCYGVRLERFLADKFQSLAAAVPEYARPLDDGLHRAVDIYLKKLSLEAMLLESKEKPYHVTMIIVLCGCSHAGLVEEGYHYFDSMNKDYGLEPEKDRYYTCMVDLLGRAGGLN
ncbi:Pentatricopeptide repeat superfamily protein [Perilla frutescens var. frutescens]|nr:Pentatricopeptide repeat superfamily protein [Perilla frutescens var. frutescens]